MEAQIIVCKPQTTNDQQCYKKKQTKIKTKTNQNLTNDHNNKNNNKNNKKNEKEGRDTWKYKKTIANTWPFPDTHVWMDLSYDKYHETLKNTQLDAIIIMIWKVVPIKCITVHPLSNNNKSPNNKFFKKMHKND